MSQTVNIKLSEPQHDFLYSEKDYTLYCGGVGSGKCLKKGTMVKTPQGSVAIEDLKPGDMVYGYNPDGSVSLTPVIQVVDQGIKDVVDLYNFNTVVASCTEDHRWLTHRARSGINTRKVKRIKEFNGKKEGISKEYIEIPGGNKVVPEAYAIGALIGDGCSRSSGLVISSECEAVVKKTQESLGLTGYSKVNADNYTWIITNDFKSFKNEYYDKWVRGKYAHEKVLDLATVRTWTRKSQIELISGLIDTDGSVYKANRLILQLGMQAKSVIETVAALFLDLFQVQVEVQEDRRNKYKNGSVWYIKVAKNSDSKRIIKQLKTVVPSKQYKSEYDKLGDRCGKDNVVYFRKGAPYKAQCYDIMIGNETHLYMLANGTVTHNTFIGALWAIMMAQKYPKTRGLITANTHSQLTKATLAELFKICDMLGIKYKFNVNHQRLFIGDTEVLCYTMEKPENLAGPTVGWWWGDEVAFYRQLAFDKGSARVRDMLGPCNIKFTTTPNGFNWLYEFFIEKKNAKKQTIFGKSSDNEDNLPKGYVQNLREQYDAKMAAQEIDGGFVNMNSGQVYYNFNRAKHMSACNLVDSDQFYVGLDFNVNPLAGVFIARRGDMVYVVDELYLKNSNTFEAAKEIIRRYPMRRPLVIADETGNRRRSSSAQTDHEILRRAGLEVLPFKNPQVKDRYNNVNRLFERNYIKINPQCTNLVKDLEQWTYDSKDEMLSHISDALGYVTWHINPLKRPTKKARVYYR